jgi:hypothetical protein
MAYVFRPGTTWGEPALARTVNNTQLNVRNAETNC